MVSVGSIVSVGGSNSGGSSSSGIQFINGASGPSITIIGTSGIAVYTSGNIITISGEGISASGTSDGSGINAVNGDIGPNIDLIGVNGITVIPLGGGKILINGAGASGNNNSSNTNNVGSGIVSPAFIYQSPFTSVTDATFAHNFNNSGVLIQVFDNFITPRNIIPDSIIIVDENNVRIKFNKTQTGFIVIHGPSGIVAGGGSINKFAASFISITSGQFAHNLNTLDVLIQVRDSGNPRRQIIPDNIIYDDFDNISLLFNRPQTGRLIVIG